MMKFISLVSCILICQEAWSWSAPTKIRDFKGVQSSLVPLAEATKALADRYISEGKAMRYSMVGITGKDESIYTDVGFQFEFGDMSGFKFAIGELDGHYTFLVSVGFQVDGVDGSDLKAVNRVKSAFPESMMEFEQLPKKGQSSHFEARFWGNVPKKFSSDVLQQTIDPKVAAFLKVYRSKNPPFRIILNEGDQITNLRRVMDGTGINYTLDEDGDAKVHFSFGESKREQKVWIPSKLRDVGSNKIRSVYSYAHAGKEIPNQDILVDALTLNGEMAATVRWSLLYLPDENLHVLTLTASIPENADSAVLKAAIKGVGLRADNFEEKHFKEDVR